MNVAAEPTADTSATNDSSSFATGSRPRRDYALVALATAALLLPFIDKAVHIDDPLFLRVAEQILERPLAPYDFEYNWFLTPMSMWKASQNPPLQAYLLALFSQIAGFEEILLHACCLGIAVGCAVLMYAISRRFTDHPLLTTMLAVITPAFLLQASTLMSDTTLLFFWLLAVYFTIRSAETHCGGWLWAAGLAAALAAFTKYFGVALVPLLAVYWIAREQRFSFHLLALFLPIVALALWGWHSYVEAGLIHPLGAAGYSMKRKTIPIHVHHLAVTASFLGGALLWPVFMLPVGLRLPRAMVVIVLILASCVAVLAWIQYEPPAVQQFSAMVLAGLALAAACIASCMHRRDSGTLLLALWFFGTLVFVAFLNWTVNGRVILPAVLPAALLVVRWVETLDTRGFWLKWLRVTAWPAVVVSLLVSVADYRFANSSRDFAQTTGRRQIAEGHRLFFAGHWGFQYYLQREGAESIDFVALQTNPELMQSGDRVAYALPAFNTNIHPVERVGIATNGVLDETVHNPWGAVTMSGFANVGFYSSEWGALPFGLGWNPRINQFHIAEVVKPESTPVFESGPAGGTD